MTLILKLSNTINSKNQQIYLIRPPSNTDQERKSYIKQVTEQNNKITKSRELLLADVITINDNKEINC